MALNDREMSDWDRAQMQGAVATLIAMLFVLLAFLIFWLVVGHRGEDVGSTSSPVVDRALS